MSKRYAQVIILTEDKQQRAFVTRLLQGLGYEKHKLRPLPLPAGEGAGEQYVRDQYSEQVREMHRRSHHLHLSLVVVLDADIGEVADRERQLAAQLKSAQLDPRSSDERIIHLIPRRSIETWITYLLGQQITETNAYPHLRGRESDCQPAVNRLLHLFQLHRSNQPLPDACPPSLVTALNELRHLT